VFLDIVSGNPFERMDGPITLTDIALAAVKTRSDSTRIFGRLGTMVASMPTTSSALSAGLLMVGVRRSSDFDFSDDEFPDVSVKEVGRVVKRAVSNLRKRSCERRY
jgi:hypothetical protein